MRVTSVGLPGLSTAVVSPISFRLPMRLAALVFVALLAMTGAGQVAAQQSNVQPLLDRIDRLEREMRLLNQEWARGGTGNRPTTAPSASSPAGEVPASAVARLEVRLGALEEELRQSNGRNEEMGNIIERLSQRLDKLVSDVDFRLSALERGPGGAPVPSTVPAAPEVSRGSQAPSGAPGVLGTLSDRDGSQSPQAAVRPAAPLKTTTPEEQYEDAMRRLNAAAFGKDQVKIVDAEQALKAFLDANPSHKLASNAQYWLAETYYVRGDYAAAGQAFAAGYQKYKNGAKAPDSLLKLGMSLVNLKKNREACATFSKLDVDFPKAPEHIKTVAAQQKKAAGC